MVAGSRGGVKETHRSHKPEVDGSSPSPANGKALVPWSLTSIKAFQKGGSHEKDTVQKG